MVPHRRLRVKSLRRYHPMARERTDAECGRQVPQRVCHTVAHGGISEATAALDSNIHRTCRTGGPGWATLDCVHCPPSSRITSSSTTTTCTPSWYVNVLLRAHSGHAREKPQRHHPFPLLVVARAGPRQSRLCRVDQQRELNVWCAQRSQSIPTGTAAGTVLFILCFDVCV